MSMPAYLEVAVVAATEEGLASIKGLPELSKSGIAPRYLLATLQSSKDPNILLFSQLNPDRIGLWVALDQEAFQACQAIPRYSRGFYDRWLPESVVLAGNHEQFVAQLARVWDAFCSTS